MSVVIVRVSPEEMLARIAAGEQVCAEGRLREYNDFLRKVIRRVDCFMRPLPEGKKRNGNQKYELSGIRIMPANPGEIPFPKSMEVAPKMLHSVEGNLGAVCYEPMYGCRNISALDEESMSKFMEQVENGWMEKLPKDGYGVPIIPNP
jgi:hypothetical protein